MNISTLAQFELEIIAKSENPEIKIVPYISEIMTIIEKFEKTETDPDTQYLHAHFLSNSLLRLLLKQPISSITGIDEEWVEINHGEYTVLQNKRCSALFKENDIPYYLDAITWKTETGRCWSGSAMLLGESEPQLIGTVMKIKSFPFNPKTFTIDVIEKKIDKDTFELTIKDPKQYKEVLKYYDSIK